LSNRGVSMKIRNHTEFPATTESSFAQLLRLRETWGPSARVAALSTADRLSATN